jgi:ribonuclease Z
MRRAFVCAVAILMLVNMLSCQNVMKNVVKKALTRQSVEMLTDGKMHVILVGTGGPMNNTKRASTCTAVIAGGEFLMVDVGPGSIRNADLQNLPLGALSGVLLTHFHSDHIAEVGEANFQSWANGRQEKLAIYGPEGVEKVVNGFIQAYELDTRYRIEHHGEAVMPPETAIPVVRTISFNAPGRAQLIFEKNGLKIYAFLVDHFPAEPAVGYRFEYRGNCVVLTGDTKKVDILTEQARSADILVSDALSYKNAALIGEVAEQNNLPRIAKIMGDIQQYHMSPVQAAELARDAGAKMLILNHITPPVTGLIARQAFMEGVGDVYKGDIVLGEDGMVFTLGPKK